MKSKKVAASLIALILIVVCAAGATIAYITTQTDKVTNTFTIGNIDIDLTETTTDYKIVPGTEVPKNPLVTVDANSENAWVFVKVEKTNDFDTYMEYSIADGWTALAGEEGVYYREYTNQATDISYAVLKDNKVTVKDTVTKEQLDAIGTDYPTLSFTAYAVQKEGIEDAATAWSKVSD